ncbi:MAG: hypothetical protein JJ863_23630 [Deltaproteobacteria bacterium]|nr:hypothetical protein [Deltaproteobacteria bacterium]
MSAVSVSELVRRCRERDARMPFEIGAFVALETTEALLSQPRSVGPDDVQVLPSGQLQIEGGVPAQQMEATQGVISVLSRLLVAAGAGVPPVLLELVESGPHSGRWTLDELRTELEACLVPLNRGAARRVLARLLREGDKKGRSIRPPEPATEAVDADLDALLDGRDLEPEELPTAQFGAVDAMGNPVVPFDEVAKKAGQRAMLRGRETPKQSHPVRDDGLDRKTPQIEMLVPAEARPSVGDPFATEATPMPQAPPPSNPPPARSEPPPAKPRSVPESAPTMGAIDSGVLDRAAGLEDDLDKFDAAEVGKSKTGLVMVIGLLVLLVGGGAALFILRPDVIARLTGDAPEEPEEPAEPEVIINRPEGGDLRVTAPEDAQILLYLGRGPASAEYLPVGVAHELVAIDDEGGVSRSVVPADAQWEQDGDTPRYELAMQVQRGEGEGVTLGATELSPDAMGTPTGSLGTVRVVTNPPGAKVYLLIGFGEAFVEDLPIADAHELLIERPEGEPERVVIGPSDWLDGPDGKMAEVLRGTPPE